jgi:hypothetical protein
VILLDLDGVCADLWGGVAALGASAHPYPPALRAEWGPAHATAAAGMVAMLDPIWAHDIPQCGAAFWRDLRPYSWLPRLISTILSCDRHYHVLTNPGRAAFAPYAAKGKIQWCAEHLHLPPSRIVLAADKHLLARPDRYLIDDDDRNIDAWTQAGGVGILFPQPWNRNHDLLKYDPVDIVDELLPRKVRT